MAERPLRILVISNLPPHVLGGAENQVALLVEEWVAAGHFVEVAGHRIPNGEQHLGRARVRTHNIRTLHAFGRIARGLSYAWSLSLLALRLRNRVDVVYCRGMGDGALTLTLLKQLRLLKWPLVACPINARARGSDAGFVRSIPGWRLWVRLVDRHCTAINLIAAAIQEDLDNLGLRRPRISRIPNGIALRDRPQRDTVAPVRRLCWTGRLSAQKGLDLLLPALAVAAQRGHRFTFALIGEGPDRAALEYQVRELGLEEQVRFLGAVGASEVRRFLLDMDVFMLPSRYEGMSNSALEAMETGLPVLCTACGGIDVYIAEAGAGWVCVPDSSAALVEELEAMFATPNEELLLMGRRARQLVETQFGLPEVAARNLELLRSAAETA